MNNTEYVCPQEINISSVNEFLKISKYLAYPNGGRLATLIFWKFYWHRTACTTN